MFNNDGVIVEFKGNLGREPQMRYLPDGTAVTNLSVAVNRRWVNQQTGGDAEETAWVRCALWGRLAEPANQYLEKGQQVTVRGRLEFDRQTGGPRLYTRRDGSAGSSFEVRVLKIDYGQKAGSRAVHGASDVVGETTGDAAVAIAEDDIPFV